MRDDVFDGWIAGLGATSGHRFVVGCWHRSPFGPVADVMHEDPSGRRSLLAPTTAVAEFVAATYEFDEVRVVPVDVDGFAVSAGPLAVQLTLGRHTWHGLLLRAVPQTVAIRPWWVRLADLPARVLLPGVRMTGSAGNNRREFYGALDNRRLVDARVTWNGDDLGELADVDPPVHFGFGSVPRKPSWTRVVTTVRTL